MTELSKLDMPAGRLYQINGAEIDFQGTSYNTITSSFSAVPQPQSATVTSTYVPAWSARYVSSGSNNCIIPAQSSITVTGKYKLGAHLTCCLEDLVVNSTSCPPGAFTNVIFYWPDKTRKFFANGTTAMIIEAQQDSICKVLIEDKLYLCPGHVLQEMEAGQP